MVQVRELLSVYLGVPSLPCTLVHPGTKPRTAME